MPAKAPEPEITDAMVERAFDAYRFMYREALASHMMTRTGPGGFTRLPYLEAMRAALEAALAPEREATRTMPGRDAS